ncbi:MAG: permease, partial [Candidatus Sumerlaeota bacterium]
MEHIFGIFDATAALWLEMAPYLIFGFALAGVLQRFFRSETIDRHLGGHDMLSVAKASIFGVPLPLCSCSVIPVG